MIFKNLDLSLISGLILVLILILYLLFKEHTIDNKIRLLVRSNLLRYFYPQFKKIRYITLSLSLIIVSFSLLEPSWQKDKEVFVKDNLDIIFVVDLSLSMNVQDVSKSRIERAKDAINIIINQLNGQRVGILAFAEKSFYYCPLTTDYDTFREFAQELSTEVIPHQGTRLDEVKTKIEDIFNNNKSTSKALIFISDGEFHSAIPTTSYEDFSGEKIISFVLGIGTESGGTVYLKYNDPRAGLISKPLEINGKTIQSKLNEGNLKQLANNLGGQYINISTSNAAVFAIGEALYSNNLENLGERKKENYISNAPLFVLFAAFFLAMSIAFHILRFRKKEQ